MDALYENWISRWQAALDAYRRKGGEASELIILPPATPKAVAAAEAKFGLTLPPSFRKVLTEFSEGVNLGWALPSEVRNDAPSPVSDIWGGECRWNLTALETIDLYVGVVANEFVEDGDGCYDRVWLNKHCFVEVGNGDTLGFDASAEPDGSVIFLSHEASEIHGWRLGDNFIAFIERQSLLGCPGYDDTNFRPFLDDPRSGLNINGENARKWREWFGLDFEVTR